MGNVAGGADWHTKMAEICQKHGSTIGTAASDFASQSQWHTAVISIFPEPFDWTGYIK